MALKGAFVSKVRLELKQKEINIGKFLIFQIVESTLSRVPINDGCPFVSFS
jgi:hypothetical protein